AAKTLIVSANTPDTTPPDTSFGTVTTGSSSSFSFFSTETPSTFQCRLDTPSGVGAYQACTSPVTYTGLAPGNYTFLVRAIDSAGNAAPSPASRASTVASPPPPAPVISSPAENAWVASASSILSGTAVAGTAITIFEGAVTRATTTADLTGAWSAVVS